ncbi:hypothetical protein BSCG_01025 [Bacteroides sp. 2_2_4]|nr:hypothetical protein BSCG_01025 [Bacteroides sp. 2_2_4]
MLFRFHVHPEMQISDYNEIQSCKIISMKYCIE